LRKAKKEAKGSK